MLNDYKFFRLKEIFGPIPFLRYESGIFYNENSRYSYLDIRNKILFFEKSFSKKLQIDLGNSREISLLKNSDFHFEGKCVVKFSEDKKIFFYKPKHFEIEFKIKELFDSVFKILGNELFILPDLIKTGTSYYQESIPINNNDDISMWMYNLGLSLPILKLLGLNDLHEDNIAISNNKLVIIDFETIFNYNFWRGDIVDKYEEQNSLALCNFNLLNTLLFDSVNKEINIERITKKFYSENTIDISQNNYLINIRKGIDDCLESIMAHKDSISQLLINYSSTKFRVLLRPTIFYHNLIKKYFSYDYLKLDENLKKNKVITILDSEDKIEKTIVFSEFDSIQKADIPVFYGDLMGNIYNSSLVKISHIHFDLNNFFEFSINELSEIKNEFEWILKRLKTKDFETFQSQTESEISFISSSILNCQDTIGNYRLEIMGIDLCHGLPGLILSYKNNSNFKKICINYIDYIFKKKEQLIKIPNGGAYNGLGSLLLFLLIINKITKVEKIDSAISMVYEIIENNHTLNRKKNDLMAGEIGLIIVLAIHNKLFPKNRSKLLKKIIHNINMNYSAYYSVSNLGLAHGKAGLLMSLSKLCNYGYQINKEIIIQLQKDFISTYSYEGKNWVSDNIALRENHSWCNGGVGINLAIAESLKINWNDSLSGILKNYGENEFSDKYLFDHVCCGYSGSRLLNANKVLHNQSSNCVPYEKDSGVLNLSFFFGRSGLKYYNEITSNDPCILSFSNII
ncbi:DUF4135 domain-containing protein [Daejeonella sp.]|jgi:lantibiotic modifying enzyme|uniref:DUF4135 domain-containing protein n=1 Tax=Daejeonella sp. TaxID=2805397 RepID=UPI0037BE3E51